MFNSSFRATVSAHMLPAGYKLLVAFCIFGSSYEPPAQHKVTDRLCWPWACCAGEAAQPLLGTEQQHIQALDWGLWVKAASRGTQRRCRAQEIFFFFLLGSRNEALRACDCRKAQRSHTMSLLIIGSSLEVVINLNVSDELNMHRLTLISL